VVPCGLGCWPSVDFAKYRCETSQHYSIANITFMKVVPILFKSDFIALQVDTLCVNGTYLVAE